MGVGVVIAAIRSIEYAVRDEAPNHRGTPAPPGGPGEILTMEDGSRWFHPYNGRAPSRL